MLRLLLALLIFAVPARAEMPDGADNRAFHAAIESWLANDDAESLPELTRLAGEGNVAAQILLSRIAERLALTDGWRSSAGYDGYREVFRPGALGTGTWMETASERSPLAQAFQDAIFDKLNVPRVLEGVANLAMLGEKRAVFKTAIILWNWACWDDLVRLMAQGSMPSHLRFYAWWAALKSDLPEAESVRGDIIAAARSSAVDALIVGQIRRLATHTSHRFPEDVLASPVSDADFRWWAQSWWFSYGEQPWLRNGYHWGGELPLMDRAPDMMIDEMMSIPELQQIVQTCVALCPNTRRACVRAAHSFSGGYLGILDLGSPTETLIPQTRYVRSARARWELLRHIVGRTRHLKLDGQEALAAAVATQDQCLAAHVRSYGADDTRDTE